MADADDDPTLASVIKLAIARRLVDVHTSMPGVVTAYNKDTQLASVQPALQGLNNKNERETLPVVHNVPVVFQGSGPFTVTFPVKPGDLVLLVFSEASIDRWVVSSGAVLDPKDPRRFRLTDAYAIPGVRTKSTASDQVHETDMVIATGSASLRLADKSADDPVARKTEIDALVAAMKDHEIAEANANVATTHTAYLAAIGTPAEAAALAAYEGAKAQLEATVTAFFVAHPVTCSQKVMVP